MVCVSLWLDKHTLKTLRVSGSSSKLTVTLQFMVMKEGTQTYQVLLIIVLVILSLKLKRVGTVCTLNIYD